MGTPDAMRVPSKVQRPLPHVSSAADNFENGTWIPCRCRVRDGLLPPKGAPTRLRLLCSIKYYGLFNSSKESSYPPPPLPVV